MDTSELDQQLAGLDPNHHGNSVEKMLSAYVGITNFAGKLNKPIDCHLGDLNETLFGKIDKAVREGEISDQATIQRIKEVRDSFTLYARAYLSGRIPELVRVNEGLLREECESEARHGIRI